VVSANKRACSSTGENSKPLLDKFIDDCQPMEILRRLDDIKMDLMKIRKLN
jgi:hypothetical protein